MYSNGNKFQRIVRIVIDGLNVILGIAAIVLAVMVFLHTEKNKWMFQLIFLLGATMNLITGIKYVMTDRRIPGIISEVIAVFLFAVAYFSHVAIGA